MSFVDSLVVRSPYLVASCHEVGGEFSTENASGAGY
jgi:hypothetical protein